jgi:hypothetical protein
VISSEFADHAVHLPYFIDARGHQYEKNTSTLLSFASCLNVQTRQDFTASANFVATLSK